MATTGAELVAGLPGYGWAREERILELAAEHATPWPLVPVRLKRRGLPEVVVRVASDYWALGPVGAAVRVPLAMSTAVRVCDLLPTPLLVDVIWEQAGVRLEPRPRQERGAAMLASSTVLLHHATIGQQLEQAGALPGQLVAGHLKDLVLSRRLLEQPQEQGPVIYGWHRLSGVPIQPLSTFHRREDAYYDYSHGARRVAQECQVDGRSRGLPEVLADPELAVLVSGEGPLDVVQLLAAAQGAGPAAAATGPRALRRGLRGQDVMEWQRVLAAEGQPAGWPWPWPLVADGVFGPRTEQATKAWQLARGLPADGVVGPHTRARAAAERAANGVVVAPVPAAVGGNGPEEPDSVPTIPPGVDRIVPAKHFYPGRKGGIDLVVLHSTETPIRKGGAAAVARAFASRADPASAHYCVDATVVIQCVRDDHTAFAAPGANHNGLQVEQCGYALRTDWNGGDGAQVVSRTVTLVASLCRRHQIPARRVDHNGLLAGERGITTHADVTRACQLAQQRGLTISPFYNHREDKPKTTHVDPGPSYPLQQVVEEVAALVGELR